MKYQIITILCPITTLPMDFQSSRYVHTIFAAKQTIIFFKMFFVILKKSNIKPWMSDAETFISLISALAHDLNHSNNIFLSKNSAVIIY